MVKVWRCVHGEQPVEIAVVKDMLEAALLLEGLAEKDRLAGDDPSYTASTIEGDV